MSSKEIAAFGFNLLKCHTPPCESNRIGSPASVAAALELVRHGADDETRNGITNVIGKDAPLAWKDPQLRMGASIWGTFNNAYAARIESLGGYKKELTTADAINEWISGATDGMIGPMITPTVVAAAQGAGMGLLVSTAYFSDNWETEFKREQTSPAPFNRADGGKSKVLMMELESKFLTVSSYGFKAIMLPYKSGKYSMIAILPTGEPTTYEQFYENSLQQLDWNTLLTKLNNESPVNVELKLPRFTIDSNTSIETQLSKMGLGHMFSKNASWRGMFSNPNGRIAGVNHAAKIEVFEEGTRAAAATVVQSDMLGAGPEFRVFNFDRPFLFLIVNETMTPVFMGWVGDPPSLNNADDDYDGPRKLRTSVGIGYRKLSVKELSKLSYEEWGQSDKLRCKIPPDPKYNEYRVGGCYPVDLQLNEKGEWVQIVQCKDRVIVEITDPKLSKKLTKLDPGDQVYFEVEEAGNNDYYSYEYACTVLTKKERPFGESFWESFKNWF